MARGRVSDSKSRGRGSIPTPAVFFDFDQFMTSEGTDTLILAFNSKPGQSVARYTHQIFYLDFSIREGIYLCI